MFNPTLKMRESLLFFLIVMINGLICINSNIGLNTCANNRWREEILVIWHLLGYCILRETSQRRFAPITMFSQMKA